MIKRQKDYLKTINALSLNSMLMNVYKQEKKKEVIETPKKSILDIMGINHQTSL